MLARLAYYTIPDSDAAVPRIYSTLFKLRDRSQELTKPSPPPFLSKTATELPRPKGLDPHQSTRPPRTHVSTIPLKERTSGFLHQHLSPHTRQSRLHLSHHPPLPALSETCAYTQLLIATNWIDPCCTVHRRKENHRQSLEEKATTAAGIYITASLLAENTHNAHLPLTTSFPLTHLHPRPPAPPSTHRVAPENEVGALTGTNPTTDDHGCGRRGKPVPDLGWYRRIHPRSLGQFVPAKVAAIHLALAGPALASYVAVQFYPITVPERNPGCYWDLCAPTPATATTTATYSLLLCGRTARQKCS